MSRLPGCVKPLLIGKAAEREYRAAAHNSSQIWCHAVAKYHQTVEKAVKAIVAALREAGFWRGPPSDLCMMSNSTCTRSFVRRTWAGSWFSVTWFASLMQPREPQSGPWKLLSLKAPLPGGRLRRNTEYPFHDADGALTYPSIPDGFSREEVDRFRTLAHRLAESAGWVILYTPPQTEMNIFLLSCLGEQPAHHLSRQQQRR